MGTDKGHSSGSHYKQVDTDVIPNPHHTPRPADPHCDQLQRLDKIERRLDKHDALLGDGRNEFTAIRKDIQHLTEATNSMRTQLEKVIEALSEKNKLKQSNWEKVWDSIIFWSVPAVSTATVLTIGPAILTVLQKGHQ